MGADKALLNYHGKPHVHYMAGLLESVAFPAYISVRQSQIQETALQGLRLLGDQAPDMGPLAGLLAAFGFDSRCAWLVVAVDLPWISRETLERLLAGRDPGVCATAYRIPGTDRPDPVCAIYEPGIRGSLERARDERHYSLMLLRDHPVKLLELADPWELRGVNTPREYLAALSAPPSA
jgi:cyclic pyranopterin phosphate synthase